MRTRKPSSRDNDFPVIARSGEAATRQSSNLRATASEATGYPRQSSNLRRRALMMVLSVAMLLQLIAPMTTPKTAAAANGAQITKLQLCPGSPDGTPVQDLLVNPNPIMDVNTEYYLVIGVAKENPSDDCWVSIDLPYWMQPGNMIGGTAWKTNGVAITNNSTIDKVVSFAGKSYTGTGAPGVGSPASNLGAGKVTYHLKDSLVAGEFSISMTASNLYYNGADNQTVTTEQLIVACGDMAGTAAGVETDSKALTVTKTSTVAANKTVTYGGSLITIAPGESGKPSISICSLGVNNSVVWSSLEFDLDLPSNWPAGATVDAINAAGFSPASTSVNFDGSTHYVFNVPTGSRGYSVQTTLTFPNGSSSGTYFFTVRNVKITTYGDESRHARTGSDSTDMLKITVSTTLAFTFAGLSSTRYDWYGQRGLKQNSLLGTVDLKAVGAATLSTANLTVHADFANNAIVRLIAVPKFNNYGTEIAVTTSDGNTYDGPLADVATLVNAADYAVIRNTDMPGVTDADVSITSVSYQIGALAGGDTASAASNSELYASASNKLSLWGSFLDGNKTISTYTLYETETDPADSENTTVQQTTTSATPSSNCVLSGICSTATFDTYTAAAGDSVHVTENYSPYRSLGTGVTTGYDYNPTFYLYLPKDFGYANYTINGVPITGADVTEQADQAQAAQDAGITIWKFQSPPGTEAGFYGVDGTQKTVAIAFDLIVKKSASAGSYDIANFQAVGNKDLVIGTAVGNSPNVQLDTYGINGGRALRGIATRAFTVQELKEVTADNSMRITADGGTTWSDWNTYNAVDPNNTRAFMNQGMSGEYEVHVTNQTGSTVSSLQVFVPIPKKGADFGPAFQDSPFEYDLNFTNEIVPSMFDVTYLKMNDGVYYPVGQIPQPGDYTIVTDPAQADMIMITDPVGMEADLAEDVIFHVDLGTLSPADYGKTNIWKAVIQYTIDASRFRPTGVPQAVEIAGGILQGTVYSDLNGNGVMDGLESGLAGVTVTATDNF
ncbi:MAG: hypothetical protein FWD65_07200, partial [Coriobacteriia bacterium]|nr:hypothetical protein [Coriobacteriia bacterium]